jgi:putative ABC transport system permease protein
VFVDLKTAWLIQGLGHGHDDLVKPENASAVLSKKEGEVVANASVRMFNEVTEAIVASFHFHGDEADFPIHAMIVLPHDAKSEAIVTGRYQASKEVQLIRPKDVLEGLLGALFKIEGMVVAALALVAGAAAAVAAQVFGLSFRMRQREFATLAEVGVGQGTLILAKVCEVGIIGLGALGITLALVSLLRFLADTAIINRLG